MKRKKENKCKCCNTTLKSNFRLIYDEQGKKQNIEFMLFDYIGKKLNETNGLHQAVCDNCLKQLIQCYEFKQKCLKANNDDDTSDEDDDQSKGSDTKNKKEHGFDFVEFPEEQIIDDIDEFNKYVEIIKEDHDMTRMDSNADNDERISVDLSMLQNAEKNSTTTMDHVDDGSIGMEVEYLEEELSDGDDPLLDFKYQSSLNLLPHTMHSTNKSGKLIDDSEELIKIKAKIKHGIPRHMVELKSNSATDQSSDTQNFDVEKIMTSDDLINILEDDYQSEQNYSKRARDDGDEFNLPKIDACEDIEYLEEETPVDTDEYLKSIVSANYVDSYDTEINCTLCAEKLSSHHHMMHHISQLHRIKDMNMCIFDRKCPLFDDSNKIQEHIFNEHFDLLPTKIQLNCTTCDNSFDSSVQFGKHLCLMLDSIEERNKDNNFQCETCDKKLSSQNRYFFHKQFHLKNARPKICIICEITFQEEEKFYNHVMFSHEKIFEYFCDQCDKSFASKFKLDRHIKSHSVLDNGNSAKTEKLFIDKETPDDPIADQHSDDINSVCHICKKIYKRPSRLRKHMTTHEKCEMKSVLTCGECSMAFPNNLNAKEHCHRSHDDDTKAIKLKELLFVLCCEFCEAAFVDHLKLVKHKQLHQSDAKPFKCEFCMAKYETYSKLKTHKNTHANQLVKFPVQRNYMCDSTNCWKKYRHWSDLLNHRKTVHLINPSIYKCTECEKTFYQSWKFDYHKKTVHSQPVNCDKCSAEFLSVISLRVHIKKHHSDRCKGVKKATSNQQSKATERKCIDIDRFLERKDTKMFCTECGKHLSTRNNARSHIEMVHLKIRNYACGICEKLFYLKKDLDDHTRLHTAETPYQCVICSKKFRTNSMLHEHRKIHTNERPHKCPYCASAFKRAYVLKNHIKQHIGVKDFCCEYQNCGKEYRTQWELNYHCRQKHSPNMKKSFACLYDNCKNEFCTQNDLTNHYEAVHGPSNDPANIIIEEKLPKFRRNQSTVQIDGSKKNSSNFPKIIYVLPGPADDQKNDNDCVGIKNEADHNYPTKNCDFDIETSYDSNYVYIVDTPTTTTANANTSNTKIDARFSDGSVRDKLNDSAIMDIGACQVIGDDTRSILL